MVGLSVVLEAQKLGVCSSNGSNKTQVINKATAFMLNNNNKPYSPPPTPSSSTVSLSPPSSFGKPFLDQCFLCRNRLLPGKDIYMYKGDRGFCSVECRYKQIFMDEEESVQRGICSLAAMKGPSSSSSSSSPASSRGHRKVRPRNRAGGFTY